MSNRKFHDLQGAGEEYRSSSIVPGDVLWFGWVGLGVMLDWLAGCAWHGFGA